MRKTFISPLQEILDEHIISVQDNLELALSVFITDLMQVSSGVISGCTVSSGSLTTLLISSGFIYQDRVYGELYAVSGITCSLPVSGTRTDLIVASYSQVYDSYASGFILLDVFTGNETIQNLPGRRIGSIVIEQLTDTAYATRPYNKVPLCELTLNSSGITAISDVRIYARIMRLQQDFKQNFYNFFYSGI